MTEENKHDFITYVITAFIGALLYMVRREIVVAEKEATTNVEIAKIRHYAKVERGEL